MNAIFIRGLAGLCLFAFALPRAVAIPRTYSFFQSGFTGGGFISGSFLGEDLNKDQKIGPSEISDLDVSFSGNSLLPAFSWQGAMYGPDLDLLTMRLGMWLERGGGPSDFYGVWEYYSYFAPGDPIQGIIDLDGGEQFGIIELTTAQSAVVRVPDAGSTAAMLAVAFGGLMMARRRHSV